MGATGFPIGIVSDTHGLVRPALVEAFRGVKQILHAGDVGSADVLAELGAVAPVFAVRGNMDGAAWAEALPVARRIEAAGIGILVTHVLPRRRDELEALGLAGARVVVSGHSHRVSVETRDGVLFLNPGSAGPHRFHLPATAMILRRRGDALDAELIRLP